MHIWHTYDSWKPKLKFFMSFGPGQFCNQRKHFPLPLVDSNPRPRIRTRGRQRGIKKILKEISRTFWEWVCVILFDCVRMCLCVCVCTHNSYTHTHKHIFIFVNIRHAHQCLLPKLKAFEGSGALVFFLLCCRIVNHLKETKFRSILHG